MPQSIDFSGPFLKTERADHHIRELKRVFREYARVNMKAVRPHPYNRVRNEARFGRPLPRHTSTILGDALHNLRAALDHAYYILVEANGGSVNDWATFPIAKNTDWKSLKGSVEGKAKAGNGISQDMIDFIFDEIQPFPGGKGEDLSKLHILDIADKHMILLPAEHRAHVESLRFSDGGGLHNVTLSGPGTATLINLSGRQLEKGHNPKVTLEICFGDGQPFEGQPAMPIVDGLAVRVDETLRSLEQKAKETP